ncbi:hypothetical protein OAN24_05715 [Pseudodesulfovibrio sp.]|nr:hypothetical protein [Pseudodesulfovibrio sp.]
MEHLFGGAEEHGVSKEEMDAVLANVMVVAAGSIKNKAQVAYDSLA